ncbi:MAG: metallophosphoesterase family protein [Acidianus sp.]|jgi:Icc-related predicted phosphoesterase|nr:metallophosphoesterase family protein [Acidianus sp.]
MLIAATSDIHSPRYLNDFFIALRYLPQHVDLVLLAGDLADKGKFMHFDPVYNALRKFQIVAVFGNEDFREEREKYKEKFPDVIWLDDEKKQLNDVTVIGSEGVIKKPTVWQKMKGIDEKFYNERKKKIEEMLCSSSGFKILLTHYAPTYKTVYGERPSAYPGLGDELIEELQCKPNLAIHGHAHYAKVTFAKLDDTKVYNVALPANKKFVIIEI